MIGVHQVFVNERPGRGVCADDAGPEDKSEHCRYGCDPKDCSTPRFGKADGTRKAIPTPRHRLEPIGIRAQRNADLPDREVDVLVVFDDNVRPYRLTDGLAGHDRVRMVDEEG